MTEPSPWFCDACGHRVELAQARDHFDACVGGDRDDECDLCNKPIRPTPTGLCDRCQAVAQPKGHSE